MTNSVAANFFSQLGAALGKPEGYDAAGTFDPVLHAAESMLQKAAEALNGTAAERMEAAREAQRQANAWSKVTQSISATAPPGNRIVQNMTKIGQQIAQGLQQSANTLASQAGTAASSAATRQAIASVVGASSAALGVGLAIGQIAQAGFAGGATAIGQKVAGILAGTAVSALVLAGIGVSVSGIALAIALGYAVGKLAETAYDFNFLYLKDAFKALGELGQWLGERGFFDPIFGPFERAKRWLWPRDPIILDLDGDGLETVGLASNVYFDHDGDGVLTKTGWAGKDDALLVWDRNSNGSIDTGAELFGDFTPLPNGTLAPNGFAALAALDSNGDGILDANDPAFAELKLWRDASQDGVSQGGEFISLTDAGIVSLNLTNLLKNQRLSNGNTLSREGSFTRADGTTAAMGEFKLAIDTFDTQFADEIEVPEALRSLPNMSGAGNVRELQQAATQSGAVAGLLSQFQSAPTRAEQKALLDRLLAAWADTSGMAKSMEERSNGRYRIQYDAFGNERRSNNLTGLVGDTLATGGALMSDALGPGVSARYRALIDEWTQKLHILEAFNGQYFFNLPEKKSQTDGANWGLFLQAGSTAGSGSAAMALEAYPILHVSFSQGQLDLLQQAYDGLKESVYASLAMQTRLKPYLDVIELVIDEAGIRLDATQLNQMLADKKTLDPENYLADLLDLDRYAGGFLAGTNWVGLADFDTMIDTLPQTTGIAALLNEFKVRTLTGGDESQWLGNGADIVLAGEGNDRLYGNNGADWLFGQGGDDIIYGGNGEDLLSGGAGNDLLRGDAGADTYVFGRGYGHDTINDNAENGIQRDSVRFTGLTPADIRVTADYTDSLTFTITDTGETLTIPANGTWWGRNGIGQNVFDDGTVWRHGDALRATVAATTDGDACANETWRMVA
ncbi:MAG: calcium-binding protein [Rhodocyclaceae bacterium]